MVQTVTVKGVGELQCISWGALNLTARGKQYWVPDEQAFATISAALENGAKTFISTADFYGSRLGAGDFEEGLGSVRLLGRFFKAHPQYREQVFLHVKGCSTPSWVPDASPSNINRSVRAVVEALDGKRLDSYGPARIDAKVGLEATMQTLVKLKNEGLFDHITLSEVSASTLRKAHAIHPITAIETEISAWATEPLSNGLLDVCRELGVLAVAYSPFGRGFLTGQLKTPSDIPPGDVRLNYDRFQPGNFEKNLAIVEEIDKLAVKKGVTKVQLLLAWLLTFDNLIAIPGSTRAEGVKEGLGAYDVKLNADELKELQTVIDKASATVVGGRYNDRIKHLLFQ